MIRLEEDDVPGNPGATDYMSEARRRALESLAEPISADPVLDVPMVAPVAVDRPRGLEPGRDLTAGFGDADTLPPNQGGAAEMPEIGAPVSRRVVLSEDDVPAFDGRPARQASVPSGARGLASPRAPRPVSAAAPMQPTAPKSASDQREGGTLDAELRASREAQARRLIMNTLATGVESIGSLAANVPVHHGTNAPLSDIEGEASIRARHASGAAEKERTAQATALAQSRAEREASMEDREMALRERGLQASIDRASQPRQASGLESAREDQIRSVLADREARRDPFSPQSRAAQGQFSALIDAMPARERARLAETFTPERVRGMSADELAQPTSTIGRITPRVGNGGGAGGGANRAQTRESLTAAGRAAGLSDEVMAAMPVDDLVREINTRGRSANADASDGGVEVLPGVFGSASLVDRGEGRSVRDGFASARASMANLDEVEDISRRYGTSGVVSREAAAEMRPRLVTMRAMVAQMGNTGVINPTEVPTINAALPDPTSLEQMTIGDFRAQSRAWRSQIDSAITSRLATRGVDDAGIRRALAMLHGGSAPARAPAAATPGAGSAEAPAQTERVTMVRPDGRRVAVAASQREQALARGYTEAP